MISSVSMAGNGSYNKDGEYFKNPVKGNFKYCIEYRSYNRIFLHDHIEPPTFYWLIEEIK